MDTITRQDQYFDAMSGGSSEIPEPITRKEQYYAKMAGEDVDVPEPITREEFWLHKIIEHGGGGSTTTIEPLTVTENGSYSETGKAYSPVNVNVPQPSGSTSISENGVHNVTAFAEAVVNVPNSYTASDEGKVVSSGALVAQTSETYTENGTYDTTLKNSVTVNVSGGGGGNLIVGALRPDSELWKKYTYDKRLVNDLGLTIPSYSTSNVTLISQSNIETVTLDLNTYDYFVVIRALATPEYNGIAGARTYYSAAIYEGEIFNPGEIKDFNGGVVSLSSNPLASQQKTSSSFVMTYQYGSDIKQTSSNSFGINTIPTSTSYNESATAWTLKSPSLTARGHQDYMSDTAWGQLTDIRFQYVAELYRSKKGVANIDGYNVGSNFKHLQNCIANGGTLT